MGGPSHRSSVVSQDDVDLARVLVQRLHDDEMNFPGSPVTPELVRLNTDHAERVRATSVAIAWGEGLDESVLELGAVLHDIAKLDHRDIASGGIDTWHHHHRGASLARKLMLVELEKDAALADRLARLIEPHSDIPFIRRYWQETYGASPKSPRTPEEFALRDADVMDMLWVGGIAKIVCFRQVEDSVFFREDRGDIRMAIASAHRSFLEAAETLTTPTARELALVRIRTVERFFSDVARVGSLEEFMQVYDDCLAGRAAADCSGP